MSVATSFILGPVATSCHSSVPWPPAPILSCLTRTLSLGAEMDFPTCPIFPHLGAEPDTFSHVNRDGNWNARENRKKTNTQHHKRDVYPDEFNPLSMPPTRGRKIPGWDAPEDAKYAGSQNTRGRKIHGVAKYSRKRRGGIISLLTSVVPSAGFSNPGAKNAFPSSPIAKTC